MERKKIKLSLKVWEKAQRIREKEGISWDQFVLRASGVSREISFGKGLRSIWNRIKGTERYQRSLDGELEASLFFLKPTVIRLLSEAGRKQRRSSSELLENLIVEKFGVERGEYSEGVEAPTEAPEKDDVPTEAPEKDDVPSEAPEEIDAPPSTPEKDVPKRSKKATTVIFDGRSLDLEPVPEDREKDSKLSIAAKRWLRKHAEWLKEAERWKWKPSMTLIWPEGTKARILFEEEEIQDEVVQKIRGLFIYHLKSWEDLRFIRPYRLDFYIERKSKSEFARIEPEVHRAISFQLEKHSEMKAKLEEKATVFEKLEKDEIGDQIG